MSTYNNKVCVVTGAGSGIGRALATQLADAGAHLAISDIDATSLEETRALLPAGTRVKAYSLDVSSRDAWDAHAEEVLADFGAAHFLFNNAGVTLSATIENGTIEEYEWLLGINLWGPIYGTKAFLPAMLSQGEGHVVNFSSVFGFVTVPTQSAYHISKFGIRGFTECLSRELEGSPVHATTVHPGGIATKIGTGARVGVNAGATEQQFLDTMSGWLRTSSDDCARGVLKGVARRKKRVVVGYSARQLELLPRLFPTRYGPILHRLRGA
jgi:NAD(P)-dependent dehydrogenase (short-subunit alcohol dehydrogenase family)